MKAFKILAIAFVFGTLLWSGCHAKENGALTGIRFNRGHGSAWGNQFYIEIQPAEIVEARYIPQGQSELVTVEHIPITDAQWQSVQGLVEQLPLEKARTNIWDKQKLDGGAFRELTLVHGKQEAAYMWPDTPQAEQLEQLLEQLIKNIERNEKYVDF